MHNSFEAVHVVRLAESCKDFVNKILVTFVLIRSPNLAVKNIFGQQL